MGSDQRLNCEEEIMVSLVNRYVTLAETGRGTPKATN